MNYAEVTFIYINISSTPYRKEDSYLSLSVGQATKNQNSSTYTGMKFQKCATINRVYKTKWLQQPILIQLGVANYIN
jgi:hypothetical protein